MVSKLLLIHILNINAFLSSLIFFHVHHLLLNLDLFSGFQQPLAACCGYGGPPLNFDTRIACGLTKNLNGSIVTANPCNNTAEYINWDGNHYTEAANRFVADLILTGNYSDSPHLVNTPLILT